MDGWMDGWCCHMTGEKIEEKNLGGKRLAVKSKKQGTLKIGNNQHLPLGKCQSHKDSNCLAKAQQYLTVHNVQL